jgi:hypothetical protein
VRITLWRFAGSFPDSGFICRKLPEEFCESGLIPRKLQEGFWDLGLPPASCFEAFMIQDLSAQVVLRLFRFLDSSRKLF